MKSFMVLIVTALAMGEILAMAPDLLKGNQMVASVFEIIDRKTEVTGDTGEDLRRIEGTIELKGVRFSYPSRPDAPIFKDFNLRVRAGQSMALVGQSGSGKSSVISLILRFYDPTAGKVLIDGEFFLFFDDLCSTLCHSFMADFRLWHHEILSQLLFKLLGHDQNLKLFIS